MHTAHREFTYSRITSQAAKESIGNEINLELAVRVSAHQITYPDYLAVQSLGNCFQNRPLCQEFGTDIFVGNILSDVQIIFTENSGHWRNTVRTLSRNGNRRNLDQSAAVILTEIDQIFHTLHINSFQYIISRKMLYAGSTVNDGAEFVF